MKRIVATFVVILSTAGSLIALDSNSVIQNIFFYTNRCQIEGRNHITFDDDFDSFNLLLSDPTITYRYIAGYGEESSVLVSVNRIGELITEKTTQYFYKPTVVSESLSRRAKIQNNRISEFVLSAKTDSETFQKVTGSSSATLKLESNKGRRVTFAFDGESIKSIKLSVDGVAKTEITKVSENSYGTTFSISYFGPTEEETYLYILSVVDNSNIRTLTGHFLLNFNPTMLSTDDLTPVFTPPEARGSV